jgi:hypothetical protein
VRDQDDQNFILLVIGGVAGEEILEDGNPGEAGDSRDLIGIGLLD